MNQQEIEKQINDEVIKYNNSVSQEVLPQNFIELFKKAAMNSSPATFRIANKTLKSIMTKPLEELTTLEVRIMLNVIRACPPVSLYKDYKDYVRQDGNIEALMMAENMAQKVFEKKLNEKKSTLMQLAGIGVTKSKILKAN